MNVNSSYSLKMIRRKGGVFIVWSEKRLKFIEENRVSPEEQVYLGLGAVLVDVNSASSLVFKMRGKPKYMAQIIEAGWGLWIEQRRFK
ncbi:hypothetical protein [Listeria aquatica]|uniref:hypothetical protein n=1 Tax=Listeria aquatica TaxID=1494960 RepID=UPI0031F4AA42